ncbi:hypothetical protein HDV00_001614 [Rhizophlyctis rosea]|nr:hypothetical protein HDV00_001614 [Rhizophlyctis rosea]
MIVRPRVHPSARFPPAVTDIFGNTVDVLSLAQSHTLILITLKAPWCPVCPELLRRLSFLGFSSNPQPSELVDTLLPNIAISVSREHRQVNSLLLSHDARFLILCPGPAEALVNVRRDAGWDTSISETSTPDNPSPIPENPLISQTPWIPDPDLTLAKSLGLAIPGGMWPAILEITPTLEISTIEIGRSPGYYSDTTLLDHLLIPRQNLTWSVTTAVESAGKLIQILHERTTTTGRLIQYDHPRTDPFPQDLLSQIIATYIPNDTLVRVGTISRSFRYVVLLDVLRRIRRAKRDVEDSLPRIHKSKTTGRLTDTEEWIPAPIGGNKAYPSGTEMRWVGINDVRRRNSGLEDSMNAGVRALRVLVGEKPFVGVWGRQGGERFSIRRS